MQRRSEETRLHILESAQTLFSRLGYDATGVAEICQAAGVSKGAFYHHFPSKQAIFLELIDSWLTAINAAFALTRQETESIPQALLKMAEMVGNAYQMANVRLSIVLEFWTQAQRTPAIWHKVVEPYHRYQAYFADLIREGIAEGSLQPVDPDLAARVIVSLAMGLLMQAVFDPSEADWKSEAKNSVEVLVNGLIRRDT